MTKLEAFLKTNGPTLSGALIQWMRDEEQLSDDAIRKRLSRVKAPIYTIKGVFIQNQTLFYLQEQFRKPEFYDGLVTALEKAAARYYAVLIALKYHQGFISKDKLASFTFSPVKNLLGHKKIENILSNLLKWELISTDDEHVFTTLNADLNTGSNFNYSKGMEVAERFILNQFIDYAKSIGLITFKSQSLNQEFGKLQWGFVAPSYISGIVKNTKKPAFVIADALIGKKATLKDINFFVQKLLILKHQRSMSNFLPFLFVEGVEADAFKKLKSHGVIVAFVNKVFGSGYSELLRSLISTITNAGAILKTNPNAYIKLIEQIRKLVDGKTNNLRGDLFELAVGYYHSSSQILEIGKIINLEGTRREIDVFAVYQTELRIAECKGYKHELDLESVEKWLNQKIPIIYKWAKDPERHQQKDITFELWSTGGFTSEARNFLSLRKTQLTKYNIEFYSEAEIIDKARKAKISKITDIMLEYFSKEV